MSATALQTAGRPGTASRAVLATAAVLLAATLAGCLQLVAPYDDQTEREIFAAARTVDQFYGELLEARADARRYARFADRYVQIETELRALVLRNEVRPLNEDSVEIARNILTLWTQAKDRHQKRDGYEPGAARLDRDRFARMFRYALAAERLKPGGDGAADNEDAAAGEADDAGGGAGTRRGNR